MNKVDPWAGFANENILRGLEVLPRRKRHTGGAAGGGTIVTNPSPLTVLDNAAVNAVVGTPSVIGGASTSYTYTLTDPSGKFTVVGGNIVVAASLVAGTYPVTINATGNVPGDVLHLPTTITVLHFGTATYYLYGF